MFSPLDTPDHDRGSSSRSKQRVRKLGSDDFSMRVLLASDPSAGYKEKLELDEHMNELHDICGSVVDKGELLRLRELFLTQVHYHLPLPTDFHPP